PRRRERRPRRSSGAPHDGGQELGTPPDVEVPVESGHILMDRGLAETETRGDLLLAFPLQQARERLPQSPREPVEARVGVARKRLADQWPELPVEEAQQPLLAWGEFSLAEGPMQGDHADDPGLRHLVDGRELIIDVGRPMI